MTATATHLRDLATDPAAFRAAILIDHDGEPVRLAEVIEPWQDTDFRALDAGLRAVVGQRVDDDAPCVRHWLERPRGHSKTSDIGLALTWLLFGSRRPLRVAAVAADQDQAGLLRDAIERLVRLNRWLGQALEVQARRVRNHHTGSTCEILTSDAPSAYGQLLDAIVADELTHWARRDMWDVMVSTAAKRRLCWLAVITNAGFGDSWQWGVREQIRQDPAWRFSRLDGPVASWITADRLDEQRRLLPDVAFRRLWLNCWTSGSGDALDEADIVVAVQDGPPSPPGPDEVVVGGLDLGLRHDATAFVAIAKHRTGRLRVVQVRRWQAAAGGKLDLAVIEQQILRDHQVLRTKRLAADPWQAAYLCERLRRAGVPVHERQQAGSKLVEQAMALTEAFRHRTITIPPDETLLRELRRARIEERSYGVRLVHERDETGHGDVVSALSLALACVKDLTPQAVHLVGWQPQGDMAAALRGDGVARYRPASRMAVLARDRLAKGA